MDKFHGKISLYDAGGNIKKDWYVFFKIKDPRDGRKKVVKRAGGLNRIKDKKARREQFKILAQSLKELLRDGWNPFEVNMPKKEDYGDLMKTMRALLALKKNSLRHKSFLTYQDSVNLFERYLKKHGLTHLFPFEFTYLHAQEYIDHLSKSGNSNRTLNNRRRQLILMFNAMVEREIIQINPVKRTKKLPEEVGRNIAFSDIQRTKLKEYLEKNNPDFMNFVMFIFHCFIRPKELLSLQIKHVNIKASQIIIPAEVSKNRKQDAVEIPASFLAVIKQMRLQDYDPEYYVFSKGFIPGPTFFHPNRASELHREILKANKIANDHTLYSWKHTGVMAAYAAGIDVYSLMKQLRHHSLNQTAVYLKSLGLERNTAFATKAPEF